MNTYLLLTVFLSLFILEIIYFKIADFYNIIDKPNERSSHTEITLRGGGIIFAIALLLYPLYSGLEYIYFQMGLAIIAIISFSDDIKPVSNKIRIIFHLVAVACMFYQLGLLTLPLYWIAIAFFVVIGSINAINFMDGINGITGAYSLITLCSLLYINEHVSHFIESNLIITSILSVVVFNFFNFRYKAKCFAGDVGSVSVAFIILFLLLKLIVISQNLNYILLLLLYGLDTATTIGFRIIRHERLQEAHRAHFYQYLANERKFSHLRVASIYAIIQLIINFFIINFDIKSIFMLFILLLFSTITFVVVRISIEGSSRLLKSKRLI